MTSRASKDGREERVNELREMHDKAFQDIKDYYNEITSSNLETIKTLKDEVYSRKRTEAHNEKAMFEIAQANKRLTEPLTKAQRQKKQLETELANSMNEIERHSRPPSRSCDNWSRKSRPSCGRMKS